MIEQAYCGAEVVGRELWCQDEAGPDQTVPYPGENWPPEGQPVRQAHEDIRHGTATLLTLFRPHTGEVRATGGRNAPTTVLHPWLQAQLTQILATLPAVALAEAERPVMARWETWLGPVPRETLPPLRLILVGDNLAEHRSYSIGRWLFEHGVLPLTTPLSGSWLKMAESLPRIMVRRARAGQHPATPDDIITWLEDPVAGGTTSPTPLVGDGKRHERRVRARTRRLGGSAATLAQHRLFTA
ncbi:MAG: transposase [Chloroflexota bacterium]